MLRFFDVKKMIPVYQNSKVFHHSFIFKAFSELPYRLEPYAAKKIQTLSMENTLQLLGLRDVYKDQIKENMYLLGVHGTSTERSRFNPARQENEKIQALHNPNKNNDYYIGDSLPVALHYAELNSYVPNPSNTKLYSDWAIVLCFGHKDLLAKINAGEITMGKIHAWVRKNGGHPEETNIGYEIIVPPEFHSELCNLLLAKIAGHEIKPDPCLDNINWNETINWNNRPR